MQYPGNELELFADAVQWKSYVRDRLGPFIQGRILEVGAGIGGFTEFLSPLAPAEWYCLEPDQALLDELVRRRKAGRTPATIRPVHGRLADLLEGERFDTILYLDVLEHIADDRAEADLAAARLRPGGHLIVLGPAFQFVFSPFDAAIGHHRRYTRTTLERVRPKALQSCASYYLDAPGLLLSLGNRLLLRRTAPRPADIAFWDRRIVPLARFLDPLVGNRFGRSVVAVWQHSVTEPLS
jgi:SAM-dependent methyltransferase